MPERAVIDRFAALALVVLMLGLGLLSFDRARRERFDFHHFYLDARYVWEHGVLNPEIALPATEHDRQLPFYLPVVPLLLAPLAAFGLAPAALIWVAAQLAALGYSLRMLRSWCTTNGARWSVAFLLAVGLAVPALLEASRFNQLSYFVLALLLAGWRALDQARPRTAGVLFAGAAVIKLLPGLLLIWLLLKRQWTAAATFAVAGVAFAVLPPFVFFGPGRTLEYHREWWQHNVSGDAASGLLNADLPDHFIDHRNQSIPQVLARWTWPGHRFPAPLRLVHLERNTCQRVAFAISGAILAALVVATRKGWHGLGIGRRHAEAAAYAIGMLVLSPLVRQYYLVWALPALVVLADAALHGPQRWIGWAGLGIWTAGMVAWIWPVTRTGGLHLAMLILIAAAVLYVHARRATTGAHVTVVKPP